MIEHTTVDRAARIAALAQLGEVMGALGSGMDWPGHACGLGKFEYEELDALIGSSRVKNGWFTEENVRHAFRAWSQGLGPEALGSWLRPYATLGKLPAGPRTVGLILAGNIPLVGLHDVLCVWLSGHRARVKYSSLDPELIPALVRTLDRFLPGTTAQIELVQGKLGEVDAVIATGSNNTSRYFEHYFGHVPRIVRKSRVSVAVLDGTESPEELAGLAEDVLRYFGMGCRNVSKLYIPHDLDLDRVFGALFPWKDIIDHNKYANNYDYTRALWMLDGVDFLENGFLLVKEDPGLASPVSTLFYERYTDRASVDAAITEQAGSIQCVVGHGATPFGKAQQPSMSDYADGVDTLRFLMDLS